MEQQQPQQQQEEEDEQAARAGQEREGEEARPQGAAGLLPRFLALHQAGPRLRDASSSRTGGGNERGVEWRGGEED